MALHEYWWIELELLDGDEVAVCRGAIPLSLLGGHAGGRGGGGGGGGGGGKRGGFWGLLARLLRNTLGFG